MALDPRTIPQIFTTETLLISRDLLVEKLVTPSIVAPVGPLKGIAQSNLPSLRGYVLTYPKPRAELLMKADKDPLLVSWRYGLGRVMAFTSDLSGRWGKDWVTWHGFSAMEQPAGAGHAAQVFGNKKPDGLSTGWRSGQGGSGFCLEGRQLSQSPEAEGQYHGAESSYARKMLFNKPRRVATRPSSPRTQRGIHFLTLYAEDKSGEAPLPVATVPYIAPYPKEYRELKPNMATSQPAGGRDRRRNARSRTKSKRALSGFTRRPRVKVDADRKPGGRWRAGTVLVPR